MKDSLDKLFAERQAKIDTQSAEARTAEQKRQEFRIRAIDALNAKIAPTLKIFETDLKSRGEEVELKVLTEKYTYPSATLKFKNKGRPNSGTFYSPSSITFSADEKIDGFKTRFELWVQGGKRDTIPTRPHDCKIDTLDEAWVEKLVLGFITEVVQNT
jgi:hypothetical protein